MSPSTSKKVSSGHELSDACDRIHCFDVHFFHAGINNDSTGKNKKDPFKDSPDPAIPWRVHI